MTPLILLVLLLTAGAALGVAADGDAGTGAPFAVAGVAGLTVAACLSRHPHSSGALALASSSALACGVGLGAHAVQQAWQPPGLDLEGLERAVARGEPLRVAGVLRRDAWRTADDGVAMEVRVRQVEVSGAWRGTDLGARVTVGGSGGPARLEQWTRGTRISAPVSAFRRPQPYRNFGVEDAERGLAMQGLRVFATVKSAALVDTRAAPARERWAAGVRQHVRRATQRHLADPTSAAIVNAILIGDRSALPPELETRLQQAGVYHVVAISGGNVAAFLAMVLLLPRVAGWHGRTTALGLGAGLLAFAWVVDGGASVARAVLVAAVALAARWWDIRVRAGPALAVAAAVQLVSDPLTVVDAGAVFSFGAAAALVWVAQASHRLTVPGLAPGPRVWAMARGPVLMVMATMAVEAVLLPVAVRWFGIATAAGIVANLVAVPAMLLVQVAGTAVVGLADLSGWAADRGGVAAVLAVQLLVASGHVVQWAPWLVRHAPPPSDVLLLAYYLALAATATLLVVARGSASRSPPEDGPHLQHAGGSPADRPVEDDLQADRQDGPTWWRRRGARRADARSRRASRLAPRHVIGALTACVATAAMLLIVAGGRERSAPQPWTWPVAAEWQSATWPREPWLLITMLDVGQGDATVLRFPSGQSWLIDAGGSVGEGFDVGARVTTRALWGLGHRQVSRVVVTHAHPDHAAGMPAVIERFTPREVLTGIDVPHEPVSLRVAAAAHVVGASARRLATGETFADGPVHVRVLHPDRPDWERRRVRNEDSVALWIRFGDVGVLLPGDAGRAEEAIWVDRIAAAPLTVLRLAHHGSATSTGERLVEALSPALAIGSMGRGNRFGHPAASVVSRLGAAGVPLLRTDEVGAIQLATNGRTLLVRTASGLSWGVTTRTTRRAWSPATPLPSGRARPAPASGRRPRAALPRPRSAG